MAIQLNLAKILDEFVEDLNKGVTPRVYELMASEPEVFTELMPLLDLISLAKASTSQVPTTEKEAIKAKVLATNPTEFDTSQWSMRRLVNESKAEIVAEGKSLGLASTQFDAVSSDTTPLDLDNPQGIVAELVKKYDLPKQRVVNLFGWINQLISDVLRTQSSTSPVFARDGEPRTSEKESRE